MPARIGVGIQACDVREIDRCGIVCGDYRRRSAKRARGQVPQQGAEGTVRNENGTAPREGPRALYVRSPLR